jgi:hypothetical protein
MTESDESAQNLSTLGAIRTVPRSDMARPLDYAGLPAQGLARACASNRVCARRPGRDRVINALEYLEAL